MTKALQKDPTQARLLTRLFYSIIGLAASLSFFLILYWSLRENSSITSFIANTYGEPLYFWPYVFLTLGTIVLFGFNAALLTYRLRKFGFPKLRTQAAGGGGTLVGILAAACPVCGSAKLAALGIVGGLAAFPLQGLELKALSFILIALPVWFIMRDLRKLACADATCLTPRNPAFKKSDSLWLIGLTALTAVLVAVSWNLLKTEPIIARSLSQIELLNPQDNQLYTSNLVPTENTIFDSVAAKVLPPNGFQSKIILADSLLKLAKHGVIDRTKLEAIYQDQGGLPNELQAVLNEPSNSPIRLTRENANYYVNLLWPLGLANYMSSNKESPINGKSLFNFASTGGWNLGKEENGGAYFNKFKIVALTPEQETLATNVAQNSFRPCCNNSTFFQDCNHGSALLGLLELGASQGLTERELYREALAFNSFWFPHNYVQTALFFRLVKGVEWSAVDPREMMGFNYSAVGPWSKNIASQIARIPNLLPQDKSGAGCGV